MPVSRFARQVKAAREAAGLSLRAVAIRTGISAGFLCGIEKGRRMPGRPILERLAVVFDVPLEELLRDDPREGVKEFLAAAASQPSVRPLLVQLFQDVAAYKLGPEDVRRALRRDPSDKE